MTDLLSLPLRLAASAEDQVAHAVGLAIAKLSSITADPPSFWQLGTACQRLRVSTGDEHWAEMASIAREKGQPAWRVKQKQKGIGI